MLRFSEGKVTKTKGGHSDGSVGQAAKKRESIKVPKKVAIANNNKQATTDKNNNDSDSGSNFDKLTLTE